MGSACLSSLKLLYNHINFFSNLTLVLYQPQVCKLAAKTTIRLFVCSRHSQRYIFLRKKVTLREGITFSNCILSWRCQKSSTLNSNRCETLYRKEISSLCWLPYFAIKITDKMIVASILLYDWFLQTLEFNTCSNRYLFAMCRHH